MAALTKDALRKELSAARDALSAEEVTRMSGLITERLLSRPRFKAAGTVAFYLAKGNEVQTSQAILESLHDGKEVLIPVTGDHHIEFYRFSSFRDLEEGRFKVLQPRILLRPASGPDLVVVPGLAFGFCMHRLGYGKGYYDRYLSKSDAYRIGLSYEMQLRKELPSHEDDQRMDEIVTEERLITKRL